MSVERARISVRGAVQGVGFRSFVFRLAGQLGLNGWVLNSTAGVFVEVEGEGLTVRQFLLRLEREKPPRATIQSLEFAILDPAGYLSFEIRYSDESGAKSVLILPDIATCADCLPAPTHQVQHHWAHVLSCMAENEVEPPALGVSWDGTGYGTDGTIWGGEFLLAWRGSFERVARFRQFRLPGGEAAIRQPSRTALGVLFEIWGAGALGRRDIPSVRDFLADEIRVIRQMLARGLNAPVTSSAGRLFDAVASLIGLRHRVSFEGQAAMELEFAIQLGIDASYPFKIHDGFPLIVDWGSAIEEIVGDAARGRPAGEISAKFHNTLAEIVRGVALRVGEAKIVLTGGCFQNRHLTEACLKRLLDAGFRPYWHQRVPPNDGGISLGQVVAAAGALRPRAFENQLAAA